MGGIGSGRHRRHNLAERCLSLDATKMQREGALDSGASGCASWGRGDNAPSVCYYMEYDRLLLTCSMESDEEAYQRVAIDYVPCHFGGERAYFICPNPENSSLCLRRVGQLYLVEEHFVCRACGNLSYKSQREKPWQRGYYKVHRIRGRLGGKLGFLQQFPARPKGMWHRTYARLYEEAMQIEAKYEKLSQSLV